VSGVHLAKTAGDFATLCLVDLVRVKVRVVTAPETAANSLEFHADWALAILLLVVSKAGPACCISAFRGEEILVALPIGDEPSLDGVCVRMGSCAGLPLFKLLFFGSFLHHLLLLGRR
jgi:hypothetical protein